MKNKKLEDLKRPNPVAKYQKRSGTGVHKAKFGKLVSRARMKELVQKIV